MTVELFGIARARAGAEKIVLEATTLGAALRALAETCPNLVPEVIREDRLTDNFLASLNGELFVSDPATELRSTDSLLILGAQAGG